MRLLNQRKLLITSREVAIRNQTTIAAFLGQIILTTIFTDQSLNIPQKTAAFMLQLQELRFPLLSEAEHDFQMFVKTLPLLEGMSVTHTPSFENDDVSLTINCSSKEQLLEHIHLLKKE